MYNDTTPWLNASTPEEFIDKATYHFDKADFNGAVQRNDSDVSRWSARQYELGHALRYVVRGTERFPDDERLKQLMFDGVWMLSESIFYATLLDRNPMNVFPDTFIVRSHWRRAKPFGFSACPTIKPQTSRSSSSQSGAPNSSPTMQS
jgi:hypothetical protein